MRGWQSESLWGIRTGHDIKKSLDVLRGRRPPTHNAVLAPAEHDDPTDTELIESMIRRERPRFAKQARAIQRQQARVLALRRKLYNVWRRNQALQRARAALLEERVEELRQVRDDFRKRHQVAISAGGQGRPVKEQA